MLAPLWAASIHRGTGMDAGKPIACLFFRYATFLRFGLMSVNGDHLDKQEQVP